MNRLMQDKCIENYEEATVFGSNYLRSSIHSITFLGTLDGIPEDAWDVSEDGNGSVMTWVSGYQDLFIAANGEIKAGDSCEGMFARYENLKKIEFNGLFNTSQVADMCGMFEGCTALEELDISGFDTSQVKTMHWMFKDCALLEELDISGFDTSQTTDMKGMFSGCAGLEELDLSGFDTLQVTRAQEMFHGCNTLQKLYVSERGFDDSQMKSMFKGCSGRPEIERKAL